MPDEDVDLLLTAFVEQSSDVVHAGTDVVQGAGAVARFCKCPPFVARAYRLGKLRQEKEENKKKPLTDQILSAMMKEKGYVVARRTIAKYREQLDIPVARMRREL